MLSLLPAISEKDIKRIHAHSLDVLQNVGIDYKASRLLEILQTHSQPQLPECAEIKNIGRIGRS